MDRFDIGARAERLAEIIRGTAVTVASADALVTVTVTPGGAIRTLHIGPGVADHYRADTLATTVLDLWREATARVEQELTDRSRDVLPAPPRDTALMPDLAARDAAGTPDAPGGPREAERREAERREAGCREAGCREAERTEPEGDTCTDAQWRGFEAAARRYVAGYRAMRQRIADSELTVTSPDRQVAVVYRGGRLADLQLAPAALEAPRRLAAQVHATLDEARTAWAARLAQDVQQAVQRELAWTGSGVHRSSGVC